MPFGKSHFEERPKIIKSTLSISLMLVCTVAGKGRSKKKERGEVRDGTRLSADFNKSGLATNAFVKQLL